MNKKAFLMLLLSLSALIIFPVATFLVAGPTIPFRLSAKNINHFNAALGITPCGDPIDTPGYPQ